MIFARRLLSLIRYSLPSHTHMILAMSAMLLLSVGTAISATTQAWTAGWDNFSEPLDFIHSSITWSVSSTARLTITYKLVGAKHSKLYQVGLHVLDCGTYPATFGQFPFPGGPAACPAITRQGMTDTVAAVEFGVVTTDIHGNGSFTVVVGPIAAGTYAVEFHARDGAGCNLTGGAGNGPDCNVDFQSPGPFGAETTITIP